MTLETGQQAPEFTLPDQDGNPVSLAELRGRKVVLYFYPKDDTPGCTAQACGLRDTFPRFEARDAVVLGLSPDDPDKHRAFRAKYDLPFTLLADTGHEVAERYGVWGEQTWGGKISHGVDRTTFLVDEHGRIARVYPKVDPATHAAQLLEALGGAERRSDA